MPRPGFANKRFPQVGQTEPKGNYRSQINTSGPFQQALLDRVASVTAPAPVRAFRPVAGVADSVAANQSRQAFGRALTDTSSNALRRSMDEFNTEYKTQAEKSRAEDILAQRQNVFDRFRLEELAKVFGVDVKTGFTMKQRTLAAYYEREKKNSQAMVTASLLRMVGGLI
jgi:hypothetical protein